MGIINPSLKDVENLKPLDGTYPFTVETCEDGTSNSGNNKIVVAMRLDLGEGKTAKRTAHLPIDGKGAYRFENFLRAVNFDAAADQLRAGHAVSLDTTQFIGQAGRVIMGIDKGDAERDTVVKFLKSA